MGQVPSLKTVRVLVVDDNHNMCKLVRALLIGFGCEHVVTCKSVDDALSYISAGDVDVVITDFLMEPLDGVDLVRAVRAGDEGPNPYLPIIMLSGAANKDTVNVARDAGVSEFLAKPISSEALYRRLHAVIERPRPFIRAKAYFGPDRRRRSLEEYEGPERRDDARAAS